MHFLVCDLGNAIRYERGGPIIGDLVRNLKATQGNLAFDVDRVLLFYKEKVSAWGFSFFIY